MASHADPKDLLLTLSKEIKARFTARNSILSFQEYLELMHSEPRRHCRNIAQYLIDMFDYYGTEVVDTPHGEQRRFKLFDMEFLGGRDRLVGNERAQNAIYRILNNFNRNRRVTRLVLLHGPNGSAKSSLINCLVRGLEHYSTVEEGALFRFNWIFPTERISRAAIGFDYDKEATKTARVDTFAHLDDHEVDAKLIEELKDNPLFLIPPPQRQNLLLDIFGPEAREAESDEDTFILSDYVFEGNLSHKSRLIFDALLTSYGGDLAQVYKHVQVERFYVSRRYRTATVTIEPQLRVDASSRQITADRSLSSLPTVLQSQTLFEPFGDLVDGNRGLVEFNDFLKRHPDLNKYLLGTVEKGTVPVEHAILFIDAFLIGSANEQFLEAFKAQPEYASFKGRLDLLRMPYLLDYRVEQGIYDQMLEGTDLPKHLAPHTTTLAALWAVLTRLTRPESDRYPKLIQDLVSAMSPLEKARLYARRGVPEAANPEQARELRARVPELLEEGEGGTHYEGLFGMSPREMKSVLFRALQDRDFPCLSPLALFAELSEFLKDTSSHTFLRLKPEGEYHSAASFIDVVMDHYLDTVDSEVRDSLGLVERDSYERYFSRYVTHVSEKLKGERVFNPVTREYEDPSEDLIREVEDALNITESQEEFRRDIISAVAAYRIDHPDAKLIFSNIFPELFLALEENYFESRRETVERIERNLLRYVHDDSEGISSVDIKQIETTLENLRERHGYCDACAQEAIAVLLRERYGKKPEAED